MDEHGDHDELMTAIAEEYSELLDGSEQAIYIYLDDENKICNEKFSKLLGYDSPDEWASTNESFTEAFVADKSQEKLVKTYQKAMEEGAGSKIDITWKKKNNTEVETEIILVPIVFEGHLFALHFVGNS